MARGFSRNSYSQPASLGRTMGSGCRRAAARAMRATKAMRALRLKSVATRATTNSRKTPLRQDTRLPATTLATTLAMSCGRSSGRGSGVGRRAAASYHGLRFPRESLRRMADGVDPSRSDRWLQTGRRQRRFILRRPQTSLAFARFCSVSRVQCSICQPRNWLTLSSSQRSQRSQRWQGFQFCYSALAPWTRRRLLGPLESQSRRFVRGSDRICPSGRLQRLSRQAAVAAVMTAHPQERVCSSLFHLGFRPSTSFQRLEQRIRLVAASTGRIHSLQTISQFCS